ncbi:DUF5825 family protein [Streptomyces sp. NBC_00557]|uniref:DUF5825 family protein n=1 Tax=Streptomyces sp. NBC_00557 TaxID=2975776 RepID=UPI002E813165|nr:DUF5825 family protein [Streptomyces sp. NBC_00557]WUC34212.1 DUF5825 family protein [Streptomyces sp. NBC_00557]
MSALPDEVPYRLTRRGADVAQALDLSGAGRATAEAVRFLRECESLGLHVAWHAAGSPSYDLGVLRHLPPPLELPGHEAELADWRAAYSYGRLHHRRGPGFVTVLDRRQRGTAVRLTLDHPGLLAAFLRLQEPEPLDAVDPEALDLLTAERLVLAAGGWAVALPPRIRRWPVPCTAI